jgi:GT2 family glycosyltransferase
MTAVTAASVIVCTRNPGPRIRETVASILRGTEARFALLVVDQSDDDQVALALGDLLVDARVQLLRSATRGLSAGRNVGVTAASTEHIAFTDDDCVATPTWLADIIAPLCRDDRAAVVFGTVKPAPYDPALGFLPSYSRSEPLLARSIHDKHRVEGIGASMAIRKSAWVALHGFDEALGAGGPCHSAEETDFVMRALLRGFHVHETPAAAVIHSGFRTWAQAPQVLGQYLHGIGASLTKLVRLGHWQVATVLARLAVRWTVSRPVVDMGTEAHRRARLSGFLAGVRAGLTMPIDRHTGHFALPDRSTRATDVPVAAAAPAAVLPAVIADRAPGRLSRAAPASTLERVSIVVPNWNAQPFLARALEALIARTTCPYELIIVDNGSTDGSKAYIRTFLDRHPAIDATFIDNAENRFFSTACNQGFDAASPTSKYLCLYCNDVEARSDTWLQDLIDAIQPDDVIAAGLAMTKPITDRYRGVFFSYEPEYPDPSVGVRLAALLRDTNEAMHLEGHCFLLKRALLERTGLYLHTGPFAQYHSDWEWYLRFAAMGYRIAPVDLQVHHWHSISELLAFHPDLYRDLLARLDDPATRERYLAEGRPMYEAESGFLSRFPTARARWAERVRRWSRRR